jgi:hypothetical protein
MAANVPGRDLFSLRVKRWWGWLLIAAVRCLEINRRLFCQVNVLQHAKSTPEIRLLSDLQGAWKAYIGTV